MRLWGASPYHQGIAAWKSPVGSMAWMRRLLPPSLLALTLAVSCGGETIPPPTSAPTSVARTASPSPSLPPSPSPSPSASPTPEPALRLPSDAPTTYPDADAPEAVPVERLVPPGAQVTSTWVMSPPGDPVGQVGIAWARGDDPFAQEHGFVLWQSFAGGPPWRAIYGYFDSAARGVLGVRLTVDDLTGDGNPDALTFEDTGGSGACGTWRVIATSEGSATQIWKRTTCDTDVHPVGGDLVIRTSVYEPDDAHCCPSAYRTTTLRWNGASWDVVAREVTPA